MALSDTQPISEGSQLCTACGLCCDGTMFRRMPITEDEIPLAHRAGVPIDVEGDELSAQLPCPFLVDCCCTVYTTRYAICGHFRCRLLRRLETGKVDLATALDRVAEAQRLRDVARAAAENIGEDWTAEFRDRIRNGPTRPAEVDAQKFTRALLANAALDVFLMRHMHSDLPAPTPSSKAT